MADQVAYPAYSSQYQYRLDHGCAAFPSAERAYSAPRAVFHTYRGSRREAYEDEQRRFRIRV